MPWTTGILFTTEKKMAINIFKSNQIREPIPDDPEPTLMVMFLWKLLIPKSVSVRVQSEKQNYQ